MIILARHTLCRKSLLMLVRKKKGIIVIIVFPHHRTSDAMENMINEQNAGVLWFYFMDSVFSCLVTIIFYTQNATNRSCTYAIYFQFHFVSKRATSL